MSAITSDSIESTTMPSRAIALNMNILKSCTGILKLLETILGLVCLFMIYSLDIGSFPRNSAQNIMFLVTFAFFMTTLLLLISSLFSPSSAMLIRKTLFEFMYHVVAFIFYLSASLAYLLDREKYINSGNLLTAAIIGITNSILYFLSAVFSFKDFMTK